MTRSHDPAPSVSRGAVWAVRRVLAPAALELEGRLARLAEENAHLRGTVERLENGAHVAEERLAGLDARVEELSRQLGELREGLHEARRLNLRVAELTDLVTELVLPLHDREIDASVLRRLRPDTL